VLDNINVKQIKYKTMLKEVKKDLFEKNMTNQELHKVWMKMKWKQEMDEWFNQLEKQYNEVQENKYY
tara:strand:+ start:132 stop:332 length:201 start_codon:yes stop_codon:yes gene_type:complete